MAITYDAIATTTLGGQNSLISFSNIPQTYTDLVVIINGQAMFISDALYTTVNGNSTAIYSTQTLQAYSETGGDGTQAIRTGPSGQIDSTSAYLGGSSWGQWSTFIIDIMNYTSSATPKSGIFKMLDVRKDGTTHSSFIKKTGILLNTNSAISSISFAVSNGRNFNGGTEATIYGILRA
jgi:hypothetical protein